MRQFVDCGAGVVRDAHGRLFLGYDVGGKVPQRRGHGPRTHSLQRQVHELALGSLVDHGAQQRFVLRRASAHITTDQGVEASMVTEGIDTALIFSKYIGVQLPGDVVAHGLTCLFAVHIPDWNHIVMNTMRNGCEAVECWPRFLAEMRSLTKCFHDEDYRVEIQVYFRTLGQDADAPFRSFTAGFCEVAPRDH